MTSPSIQPKETDMSAERAEGLLTEEDIEAALAARKLEDQP